MNTEKDNRSGAICHATIVTIDASRRILRDAGLIWEQDRIVMIAASEVIHQQAAEKGISLEDASGKFVFPGFINTHTHLYQNLLKGLGTDTTLENWWHRVIAPAGIKIRKEHVAAAAAGGAIEALRSGVTTLVDYMQVHPVVQLSDVEIETLRDIGIRLVYGRGFRDTGRESGFPPELIEDTEMVLADVLRLKRKYEEPELMTRIWLAPAGVWALSPVGLRETAEFSRDYNVPVMMHMFETATDENVCRTRFNCSALECFEKSGLLNTHLLAVHCVEMGEAELTTFRSHNIFISHNPISNMYLASGVAPVPRMRELGMNIGLGTDGAASNNCNDMLEVIKSTALLHKGFFRNPLAVTAQEVLEMATIEAARCIGLEQEIGSLETGKKADLFILNPARCARTCPVHDPVASLVYSASSRAIEKVVINGRIVMNDGGFPVLDEIQILREEQLQAQDLLQRAGYRGYC
ncbi:MAG: amidohydrolase [Veillonellaceae bacterium]|nr:amidohydrolase [Veillonellaceae bacterium]